MPDARQGVGSLSNRRLHLILLPTEQCNFRCTYCYEDFTTGRMSAEVVEGVERLVDERLAGLRSLRISWFGGEPLLALPVVEEISAHILRGTAARPGLAYTADMTTNAYTLDVATAERLAALGIQQYQISLDGPGEIHDLTRVRADGKGSFARIWRNLMDFRDSSVRSRVVLRVHLTADNLPGMPEFLARIRETFLNDRRFSVALKPIEHLGGPNDESIGIVPEAKRSRVLAELSALVSSGTPVGPETPEGSSSVTEQEGAACYAARGDSLVIRADGSVGKCTVALTDPANTIGRLHPDGSLGIDNTRLRPWLRGWFTGDDEAIACPYRGMPRRVEPPLLHIARRGDRP
ncbi:radical SAM protein [Streptomyces sp. NRRL F-2580]|uniref:radical SAM protein n=1 Tax=Streptomyces sp. NRRL F-2580 TaxID=1463841 RepID=UPI0005686E92|nr:radical SAM protein [Streptomyces sp. NRRL F-2580]